MMQHSSRQLAMLELMGVEVWRHRRALSESGTGSNTESDSQTAALKERTASSADAMSGQDAATLLAETKAAWQVEVSICPDASWLFVCEWSSDNRAESRLYDAILFALDLTREQVSSLFAVPTEADSGSPEAPSRALKTALESMDSQIIVVLGESLAQSLLGTEKPVELLRGEVCRFQSFDNGLVISYGLSRLLRDPEKKALLWHDLQRAGSSLGSR